MSYKFQFPAGWHESDLQTFCTRVSDGTHDSPKRTEQGKLLVTSKNIIGGTLDLTKSYCISEEDFEAVNKRSKVDVNDVLLSMIGTVGEVCLITHEPDFAIKNVGLLKNNDSLKAKWLYFYLTSPQAQMQIKERLRGTTQQYLPLGEIRKLPIIYPDSRKEMMSITNVLGSLQNKIQHNQQVNQTLEQMAQALFKSWFVDFEPVKAKMATLKAGGSEEGANLAAMQAISGKTLAELQQLQSENPDHYQQLHITAQNFPAAMQDSELGKIPEGWEVNKVGDLLELLYGKSLRAVDRKEGEIPVYGSGGVTGYHDEALVPHGSIIVGRKGTVGSIYWEDDPFFPIDTTYYVKPIKISMPFCYYLMQTLGLESMNTDAAVPGLNRSNAYRLEVISPESKIAEAFSSIASNVRENIRINLSVTKELEKLRDTLLPKLLSGELSVENLES